MKFIHFPATSPPTLNRHRIPIFSSTARLWLIIVAVGIIFQNFLSSYNQHTLSSSNSYLSIESSKFSPSLFPFETATPLTLSPYNPIRQHQIYEVNQLLVSSYTAWHVSQRAIAEKTYQERRRHNVRTLVVLTDVSITHGLGDRLRGILHAYICAVISKRVLLISWNEPIPLSILFSNSAGANFTHDESVFSPSIFPNSTTNAKTITGDYFYDKRMETDPIQTLYVDSVPEPTVRNWFHVPPGRNNTILRELSKIGELQPYEVLPLIFKALFSSTDALRTRLLQSTKKLGMRNLVNNRKYISIHARLGYGTDELDKAGKRFDLARKGLSMEIMAECFAIEAVKVAKRKRMEESPTFFVATDSPEFRPLLRKALEKRIKTVKVFVGDWDVKHFRDLKSGNGDDIIKYMDTFLDIFLLASADAIVYVKSGFANLAVWMGGIEDQTLIKYKQCFKHQKAAKSMIPNEVDQKSGSRLYNRTSR